MEHKDLDKSHIARCISFNPESLVSPRLHFSDRISSCSINIPGGMPDQFVAK